MLDETIEQRIYRLICADQVPQNVEQVEDKADFILDDLTDREKQ